VKLVPNGKNSATPHYQCGNIYIEVFGTIQGGAKGLTLVNHCTQVKKTGTDRKLSVSGNDTLQGKLHTRSLAKGAHSRENPSCRDRVNWRQSSEPAAFLVTFIAVSVAPSTIILRGRTRAASMRQGDIMKVICPLVAIITRVDSA
jgi:hypothetical protein